MLCTDRVRHVGDNVAFVVAETLSQASDAAELVAVNYEPWTSSPTPRAHARPASRWSRTT